MRSGVNIHSSRVLYFNLHMLSSSYSRLFSASFCRHSFTFLLCLPSFIFWASVALASYSLYLVLQFLLFVDISFYPFLIFWQFLIKSQWILLGIQSCHLNMLLVILSLKFKWKLKAHSICWRCEWNNRHIIEHDIEWIFTYVGRHFTPEKSNPVKFKNLAPLSLLYV